MWVVHCTQGLVHQAPEEVQHQPGCGLMPEYALRPRMRRHLSVQTHPAIQDRYSEFRAKDCIMHTVLLIALIVIVVIVL